MGPVAFTRRIPKPWSGGRLRLSASPLSLAWTETALCLRGAMIDALSRLRGLTAAWLEVQPVDVVRRDAARLLRVHALRAADALQLAAALAAAENNPSALSIVTLDDRLAEAAEREGFPLMRERVTNDSVAGRILKPTAGDQGGIQDLRRQLSWPQNLEGEDARFHGDTLAFESAGDIRGMAEYGQNPYAYHPQRYWIRVGVHPRHRRKGIGTALCASAASRKPNGDGAP